MVRSVALAGASLALMLVVTPACHSSNPSATGQPAGSGGNGASGSGANSGSNGGSNGGGGVGAGGSGACSPYQALCGGTCVTVAADPNNCGSCGHACAAGQVCLGGACGGSCLPGAGQTACAGQCVDTTSDNNNCGSCGHVCGAMQGCVGGNCVAAHVFPPPATCSGGGPAVTVGTGATAKCAGIIAQTTFTWGLCSCKDVSFSDDALVDGWDSIKGPYMAGQLGGGVGANGSFSTQSKASIWGQSWAASMATAFNASALDVHHDLQSGGNVSGDSLSVTRNAYVAGNISSDLSMTVGLTLFQTAGKSHPSNLTPTQQTVTVPPPCGCATPVPVADLVAWAKTNNDNASIGLDPAIMTQAGHPARIDLPCGVYYLSGFSSGGSLVAHGNTAVFIDGSVSSSQDLVMTVADASSALDIFVSGTITAQSSFRLGSPSYPALTRLYVGGTQTLDVQSMLIIGAEIWAGNAKVLWESDTDAFGSIFAGDFEVVSRFNLHSDQGILQAGSKCPPPGGGGGGGPGGAGGGGGGTPTCGTCKDCGNQACINGTCGQCTTNAQCCPPLVCSGGQCMGIVP